MLTAHWREVDLGDVVTLQRGYDLPYKARKSGSVPVVTSTGVTDTHAEARERGPGVVTGRYGTIGEVFFIKEDYWPHNTTLFVKNFHGNDPLFIAYLLHTIDFQTHSGKSGVPGVNRNDLHALTVKVPTTVEEQRAIAGTLDDVDALLGGLDRLIAKKNDLKQAAMQQLVTGQTRLPGFHGEWEVLPFKELFDVSAGGDVNPKLSSSEQDEIHRFPIYSNARTDSGLYGYCAYADHPADSITITARGTLGVATYRDHKYTAIGRVLVLEPKRPTAGRFFAEFINSRVKFAIESTGVPQLTAPQIGGYHLSAPPYSEQAAIATVLSDMDAEMAALEQRRNKTRALKQAMMQELLTGKTRLV
jgi:type I restriction enzyme, S subunit